MTIYGEDAVPILFRGDGARIGLSSDAHEEVKAAHEAAVKALEAAGDGEARAEAAAEHLFMGEAVVIDNPGSAADGGAPYTSFSIGASTLQEALTEVIGPYDLFHQGEAGTSSDHINTPEWVASTNEDLARLLANYYSCEACDLSEVH